MASDKAKEVTAAIDKVSDATSSKDNNEPKKENPDLPVLDSTGKVHGQLPNVKGLKQTPRKN